MHTSKIYHVDVNGVAQLIWPNRFGGSGKIKAGEALKFPGPNDKFQYVLGRPYGTEYIKGGRVDENRSRRWKRIFRICRDQLWPRFRGV